MLYYCVFIVMCSLFFVVKQKTAYEMRISDWSSDVCSSDLAAGDDQRIVGKIVERNQVETPTTIRGGFGEEQAVIGIAAAARPQESRAARKVGEHRTFNSHDGAPRPARGRRAGGRIRRGRRRPSSVSAPRGPADR